MHTLVQTLVILLYVSVMLLGESVQTMMKKRFALSTQCTEN